MYVDVCVCIQCVHTKCAKHETFPYSAECTFQTFSKLIPQYKVFQGVQYSTKQATIFSSSRTTLGSTLLLKNQYKIFVLY